MVGCLSSINTEISGDLGEHPSGGEVSFQGCFKAVVKVILKNNNNLANMKNVVRFFCLDLKKKERLA